MNWTMPPMSVYGPWSVLLSRLSKLLSSVSSVARHSLTQLNGWRERSRVKKVIIFDKDGTLINIHSQWAPWIRKLVASIEAEANVNISSEAFSQLGFDDEAGRILPGILGAGTVEMIKDCLCSVLEEEGIPRCKADHVVQMCLHDCSSLKSGDIRPICDLPSMFKSIRRSGFKIAINTSDSRDVTLKTLHQLGIYKLVDTVVCGDNSWMIPKPHPVSANTICARLGVRPENAVMVGDSPCDVQLGINAQLGCSIGVLTGIAPRELLEPHADVIVQDIMEAVDLVLSEANKTSSFGMDGTPSCHQDMILLL